MNFTTLLDSFSVLPFSAYQALWSKFLAKIEEMRPNEMKQPPFLFYMPRESENFLLKKQIISNQMDHVQFAMIQAAPVRDPKARPAGSALSESIQQGRRDLFEKGLMAMAPTVVSERTMCIYLAILTQS